MAGRPTDALRRVEQGLARARETANPFSLALISLQTAQVRQCRGELAAAHQLAQQLVTLTREYGFSLYDLMGSVTLGCLAVQDGKGEEETITLLSDGLVQLRAKRFNVYVPFFLSFLAQGYAQLGRLQEALATIAEAIHLSETTLAAFWQAEAYRVKGELTLAQSCVQRPVSSVKKGSRSKVQRAKSEIPNPQSAIRNPQSEAEACFLQAVEVARQQGAKSLELRAVISLSRLWQLQSKKAKARQLLAETYGWFTEGFDTQDLQDAKALLAQLA
jgi:ATP/maltotriose-dependent transcriptional regulator MalT